LEIPKPNSVQTDNENN